jgi:antagonist of KipI
MGIRLEGVPPGVDGTLGALGDLVSFPMLPGAVEVPPDGRPIVLSVDAPTVGGYPVPFVVIEADAPVVGQLRPGDPVRFEPVDAATARRLALEASEELRRAADLPRGP